MVNTRGSRDFAEGWQRHHIIPKQCRRDARTNKFFLAMSDLGFRFNDFTTNGILLPSTTAQAVWTNLPFHSGPHPEYNLKMIDVIACIAERFGFAENTGEALAALSQVRMVQARLRVGMYQNRLTSIDSIDAPLILKRSRVIDGAIDLLMLDRPRHRGRVDD